MLNPSYRRSLFAILACATIARAEDAQWKRVAEHDDVVIERRDSGEPGIREVRATAHSPLAPGTIVATIWKHEEYVQFVPYLKRLDVLRDDGDSKLIYEQISLPILKDRDAILRTTRTSSSETGTHEVNTVAVPDEGPPASDAFVRVRTSIGRWLLEPDASGGTAVTYTLRTDGGGGVPDWIANAAQSRITAKLVRAMLDRAAAPGR